MSLDVTLAGLKGKDAESEDAQEQANSSSLGNMRSREGSFTPRGGPWVADQDIDPVGLV
jgi:hypothetical protein